MFEQIFINSLFSAFILGLMGSGHCIGMCGGIISSLSIATEDKANRWYNISLYQFGRILSYSFFGLIAGIIGQQTDKLTSAPVLQVTSGILLILMGLYISRVWMIISKLEMLGKLLWNQLSRLNKNLLPVKSPRQALLLGALWGWLPCGLVYTSLGYALTAANPVKSSLFMLFFGLGTLPATLAAGAASVGLKSWLNQTIVRISVGIIFIIFGIYTLYPLFLNPDMSHHHH